jgi:hypothetical protein
MSGSLRERSPYGQGNTLASRAGRVALAPGVARVGVQRAPNAAGELAPIWEPQEHQAQLLAVDRGILLSAGALGSGKSEPGALRLLKWALRYPRRPDGRPTKWYVIGPDFSLIRQEQFGKILEHARRLEGAEVVKRVVGGQDPRITLCHDQMIIGRSSTDPNRLKGHEVDGFWLDEVQNVEERAFRIACSRIRSTTAVRIVLTGSPEDSPDWVWKLLSGEDEGYNNVRRRAIEEGSGVWAFRWSTNMNKTNTSGVVGVVRAILDASGKGFAAQELEGRFPGTAEAPSLGVIDYARSFVGKLAIPDAEALPYAMGVDIGETIDFTWFTFLSKRGVVLGMERFNAGSPGVPRATFYPYLENRIVDSAKKWRVQRVIIDIAKSGKPTWQNVTPRLPGVRVDGFPTDAPGKKAEIIEALAVALGRSDVKVPSSWSAAGRDVNVEHVQQLRKEFEEFIAEELGNGKRRWRHPDGGHDDGIISLALAWHSVRSGPKNTGGSLSDWGAPDLGGSLFGRK